MIDVHFAIDYSDNGLVRRWTEAELADHIDALATIDECLDGAIYLGEADISDYMPSAVLRLCFRSTEDLLVPHGAYHYRYESSNTSATLHTSDDGETITVINDTDPRQELPARELLPALYACGTRFLDWIATLEAHGRLSGDVIQAREAAPKTRELLERRGWL